MNQTVPLSVSFDDDLLVLVDSEDAERGYAHKRETHTGTGTLHRAFSVFLFDGPQRVLLQQRSDEKHLWPGYWSNSCCSHPRRGEDYESATERRLWEELGARSVLHRLYRFEYHAQFGDIGAEHELCTVYIGNCSNKATVAPHQSEIMAWDWFECDHVDDWCQREPAAFTPWFLKEWQSVRETHRPRVEQLLTR